jgi:hypothetical protein
MFDTTFPVFAVWLSALLLVCAALVHLAGIRGLKRLYAGWDIPAGFYLTIAIVELAAAYFLVTPEWRLWGILIAGVIAFGSVVMLLDHGQYLYAVPVILFMLGLIPAALSIPAPHDHLRYASDVMTLLRFA